MKKTLCSYAILLCAALAPAAIHAQTIQVNKDNRTIAITTSDTAKADAETAQVHIGFNSYAPDAKTAYATASDISNRIIAALTSAGIAKTGIQSESQSLTEQPIYQMQQMPEAERASHRFLVSQTWTVSTSAGTAAQTLNTAINAGANNSGAIEWDVKDPDALQAQAAAKALQRAQAVADQMAKGLHASLGALVYASNEVPAPPSLPRAMHGMLTLNSETATVAAKPLSIAPQQVIRSATVYAVFALQ